MAAEPGDEKWHVVGTIPPSGLAARHAAALTICFGRARRSSCTKPWSRLAGSGTKPQRPYKEKLDA
jgi:hypothetical protein